MVHMVAEDRVNVTAL